MIIRKGATISPTDFSENTLSMQNMFSEPTRLNIKEIRRIKMGLQIKVIVACMTIAESAKARLVRKVSVKRRK